MKYVSKWHILFFINKDSTAIKHVNVVTMQNVAMLTEAVDVHQVGWERNAKRAVHRAHTVKTVVTSVLVTIMVLVIRLVVPASVHQDGKGLRVMKVPYI